MGVGGGEGKNKTFMFSPAGGRWELKEVLYSEILWKLDPAVIPASPETEGIKIGIFPGLAWPGLTGLHYCLLVSTLLDCFKPQPECGAPPDTDWEIS